MATSQEKEAQDLTEKVLNIRFALEKLNTQKAGLEEDVKLLQKKNDGLVKSNEEYTEANKEFEKKLAELNKQIFDKQTELEQTQSVFQDEINKKFKEIEDRKVDQDRREKELNDKEDQNNREKSINIEAQKTNEMTVLQIENMQKEHAVKEVDIKRKEENQSMFHETLKLKEDQLNHKELHLNEFNKSVTEREASLIGKLNKMTQWEQELNQLKNAIENDRLNHENEKKKSSYVLKTLEEIQVRCISHVGQTITENVINTIRDSVITQLKPTTQEIVIVDKTILNTPKIAGVDEIAQYTAPVEEEVKVPEVEEPKVEDTTTEEEKPSDLEEIKEKTPKRKIVFKNKQ